MPQYCIELGCEKQALYAYPGGAKPITCKTHLLYGMVDVRNNRCTQGCGRFVVKDGLCISCARKDGWDGPMRECKNKCGKEARINGLCIQCVRKDGWTGPIRECKNKCGKEPVKNGLCTWCTRKEGWVGPMKECKNKCGKEAQGGTDGCCTSCYNETQGIIKNPVVNTFKKFLKDKFPELKLKTEFYLLNYRIDFLIEMEELFIGIEYDQDQHKHKWKYPLEKEKQREKEILEELSQKKRTVLIRYNPSNYRIGRKLQKTPLEQRLEKLEELISESISDQSKSGIFWLFYDE